MRPGEPLAGAKDRLAAGNGALMRLSPAPIRYWNDRARLVEIARLQTATAHGTDKCLDALANFAELLADVISGKPGTMRWQASRQNGSKAIGGAHRDDVHGTGYVVDCLNVALRAVARTTSFRSAILLATNLADDADTTAGRRSACRSCLWVSGIPNQWLERLAWWPRIEEMAAQLFEMELE